MKIFVYRNKKNYGPPPSIYSEFLKRVYYQIGSFLQTRRIGSSFPSSWHDYCEPQRKTGWDATKERTEKQNRSGLQAEKPLSLDYIASCILLKPKDVFDILSKRGFVVQNNKIDRHIGIKLIDEFIAKAKSASKDEKTFSLPKSNSDILEDYNKYPHDSVLDDSYYNNEEEIRIALDCGGSISHTDGSSFGSSGIEDLP